MANSSNPFPLINFVEIRHSVNNVSFWRLRHTNSPIENSGNVTFPIVTFDGLINKIFTSLLRIFDYKRYVLTPGFHQYYPLNH